jgi:hypothetical protein
MSTRTKLIGALVAAGVLVVAAALPAGADQYSNNSSPGFSIAAGAGPRFDTDVPGVGGIYPTVNNFNNVTLNGTPQLTSANIPPFTVIDDSGTSAGWNVTLLVPDFKNGTGADCATTSTHTVAAAGVSMNAPVVTAGTGDTSMTGVSSTAFTDFTSARKIVVATATNGAGTYLVSPQILKLVVPSTAFVGTYCTQATIAIASGP